MRTVSELIYPKYYKYFEQLAQSFEEGNRDSIQNLLAEIKTSLEQIDNLSEKMQVLFFYEAFKQRLFPQTVECENLYLLNDAGQQIKQFNFMAEKFPVVTHAQEIANGLFLNMLAERESCMFVDIGIGSGQQVIRLIKSAIKQNFKLAKIVVIGIEPSAESLEKAEENLKLLASESGLSIEFIKVNNVLENLNEQDWLTLKKRIDSAAGPVFLNASFALHHIQPVGIRQQIMQRLKQLNPALFVIIEPYSEHTVSSLVQRFRNAWHHYGLTFQAIDSIDAPAEEKNNAKRVFFGREILDVIREKNRIEQFETSEMWLSKLTDVGFHPYGKMKDFEPLSFNQVINRQSHINYLSMNVGEYPIVSIIGVC